MRVTFEKAVRTASNNMLSKWPRRGEARIEGVAQPSFSMDVRIERGAKVLTMGSCFARNIEAYLASSGYAVPVRDFTVPPDEQEKSGTQGILNKYTLASIAQELEWVASVRADGGKVEWKHVEPMLLQGRADTYYDLQLNSSKWVTKERAIERRQEIYDIHVQFFDCDLAVLTPGLTECWYDTKTGLYLQEKPSRQMAEQNPDRFEFEVLDFYACHEMLERTVKVLADGGTKQIVMTVSPVPLGRTMTDKDVLIANTYSKATLRSVVGLIADKYPFIHYLPSFEKIMLSNDPNVWKPDLRHVADGLVGEIVSTFMQKCSDSLGDTVEGFVEISAALERKDFQGAYNRLLSLPSDALERDNFRFHECAAILFALHGEDARALDHALTMQRIKPFSKKGYQFECVVAEKIGDMQRAGDAIDRGVKNCAKTTADDMLGLNASTAMLLRGQVSG